MNKDIIRQLVNVVAYVAMVTVNVLSNALPINGLTTGAISDSFPVYFVPAGYVFSIWGLIYLLLLGFTVYQALPSQRENPALRRIGYWFAFSSLANLAWIFTWHYQQFGLSLILMAILLVSLITIYLRLDIGRAKVSAATRWLVHLPFSVYLGWITVATVALTSDVLYLANWSIFNSNPEIWTVIMLIVGAMITAAMIFTRRDVAYTLVILWAYVGIVVKQSGTPTVAYAAGIAAAVIAVLLVIGLLVKRPHTETGVATAA